jgi:hypothetical protein
MIFWKIKYSLTKKYQMKIIKYRNNINGRESIRINLAWLLYKNDYLYLLIVLLTNICKKLGMKFLIRYFYIKTLIRIEIIIDKIITFFGWKKN